MALPRSWADIQQSHEPDRRRKSKSCDRSSWGVEDASTVALWWLNFGPTGICRATKFVLAEWGMFGDLQALCRGHLHPMKQQPVASKRWSVWRSL